MATQRQGQRWVLDALVATGGFVDNAALGYLEPPGSVDYWYYPSNFDITGSINTIDLALNYAFAWSLGIALGLSGESPGLFRVGNRLVLVIGEDVALVVGVDDLLAVLLGLFGAGLVIDHALGGVGDHLFDRLRDHRHVRADQRHRSGARRGGAGLAAADRTRRHAGATLHLRAQAAS